MRRGGLQPKDDRHNLHSTFQLVGLKGGWVTPQRGRCIFRNGNVGVFTYVLLRIGEGSLDDFNDDAMLKN